MHVKSIGVAVVVGFRVVVDLTVEPKSKILLPMVIKGIQSKEKYSATGNRTPVSRVTGGGTHHYTIVELILYLPCVVS